MERDSKPRPVDLTGIHINFADQTIEFEDDHGTVGRLLFKNAKVLYEGRPLFVRPEDDPDVHLRGAPPVTDPEDAAEGR